MAEGLELYVLVRPADSDGIVTVTTALRNIRPGAGVGGRDALSWFQPEIVADVQAPAFVDRGAMRHVQGDTDLETAALLYRNNRAFAAGHGCAANWSHLSADGRRAGQVRSSFVPRVELQRAKPNRLPGLNFGMEFLSEASDAEVVGSLDGLVEAYRGWIEERRYEVVASENLPDELASVAERHLQQAKLAADRIAAGITVLRKDPDAMTAFCLMNEAMVAQRRRQVWVRSGAHGAMAEDEHHWRPFQLAFILLNLAGLSDPNHPDREVADLLWFPTGGGKTEAYLGLIAYTVLFRRLQSRRTHEAFPRSCGTPSGYSLSSSSSVRRR